MLAALLALPLASAFPAQESVILSGHLFDASGTPVEGGDVAVMCQALGANLGRFNEVDLVAQATSGRDGAIELEIGPTWLSREYGYRELRVAAFAEGHGLLLTEWATEQLPIGQDLALHLPAPESSEFHVLDDAGQPVAGARVVPFITRTPSVSATRLHERFSSALAATSDGEGVAILPVPFRSIRSVTVQREGGPVQLFGGMNRFTPIASDLVLANVRRVPIDMGEFDVSGVTLVMDSWSTYQTDKGIDAPRTVFDAVDLEDVSDSTGASIWVTDSPAPFRLRSHGTRSLELTTRLAAEAEQPPAGGEDSAPERDERVIIEEPDVTYSWRGTVNDAAGVPAPGVRVHIDAMHLGSVLTGTEGRFEFECSRPAGRILFVEGNTEFVGRGARSPVVSVDAPSVAVEFEPLEVRRSRSVTLRVTDPSGAPVERAYVVLKQESVGKTLTAVTGSDGSVEISNAVEGLPIDYVVVAEDLYGTGTLAATEEVAAVELTPPLRLSGRAVVAGDGNAAARARFTLERREPPNAPERVSSGGSTEVYAAPDGSFTFQAPLDRDGTYVLSWGGKVFERGRTEPMTGAELAELDEVEIRRLMSLEIRVDDPSGAPIEGAEVWFRSSTVKSWTSAAGTARLEGGPAHDRIVLLRTPAGVWHAQIVDPGPGRRVLTVPTWLPLQSFVGPPRIAEERKRLAAELARTQVAEFLRNEDTRRARRALPPLCWSEPAEVLGLLDDGHFGDPHSQFVALSEVGRGLAKESPREALSVARRLAPGSGRTELVIEVGRRLSWEEELESLALERSLLDSIHEPNVKLLTIGALAERFLELGRTDAAMALFEEGKALADTLPRAGLGGFTRASFGERLALVNRRAGIALIESAGRNSNPRRHFGNAAHKLAAVHPASAENCLKRTSRGRASFSATQWVSRVVYHMAPVDLERALRLAVKHGDTAYAHGMIAFALHESGRPPEQTLPILEGAYDRLLRLDPRNPRSVIEMPPVAAGALLPVAAAIDPDHFGVWFAKALAVNLVPDDDMGLSTEFVLQTQSTLALFVALYDTDLARALVEPCLVLPGATNRDDSVSDFRSAWSALAIIDPAEASRRAWDAGPDAMQYVAAILCRDEEERLFYSTTEVARLWAPGKEDL